MVQVQGFRRIGGSERLGFWGLTGIGRTQAEMRQKIGRLSENMREKQANEGRRR